VRSGNQVIRLVRDEESSGTRNGATYFLLLRPLVYGGDDFTFVCDGRLGLAVTALYLKKYREILQEKLQKENASGDRTSTEKMGCSCPGVATARAHDPFSRSYELVARPTQTSCLSASVSALVLMPSPSCLP
jgi:hypothetical protein